MTGDRSISGIECCNDAYFDAGEFLMQPEKPAQNFIEDVTMCDGVCIIQTDNNNIPRLGAFSAQCFNEVLGGDAVQGRFLVEHSLIYCMKYPKFGLYYLAVDEHRDDLCRLSPNIFKNMFYGRSLPGARRTLENHVDWAGSPECREDVLFDCFRLCLSEFYRFRDVFVFEYLWICEQIIWSSKNVSFHKTA
jgi:hypothetical protein